MDIEESKILLKDFQKGKIEKDKLEHYRGSYKMGYFYTVGIQEAIETVLSELEKKDKQIDLMAEQLAGLAIFDIEKDEPLILGDKEEVKQYFEKKVEGK